MIMRPHAAIVVVMFVLCATLLISGCTETKPSTPITTPPTTLATTVPTTVPPTPVATRLSVEPEPTDQLPDIYRVEVSVDRNTVAINPDIGVIFNGGKGMNFVALLDAQVIRSDGTTETKQMYKPQMGERVTLAGTKGTDRVIVYVTLQTGEKYKIFDQKIAFRSFS